MLSEHRLARKSQAVSQSCSQELGSVKRPVLSCSSQMHTLRLRVAAAVAILALRASAQSVGTGCGLPGLSGGYSPTTAPADQLQSLAQVSTC